MKNTKFFRVAALAAIAVLFIASVQQAFAVGTRAGSKISAVASISYKDKNNGGSYSTADTVAVYVAHKPATAINIVESNLEGYDGAYVVYRLLVTNAGNGGDRFAILPSITASGLVDSLFLYSNAELTDALIQKTAQYYVMRDSIGPDATDTIFAKINLTDNANAFSLTSASTQSIAFTSRSTASNSGTPGVDTTYQNDDLGLRVVDPANLNSATVSASRTILVKQSKLTVYTIPTSNTSSYPRPGDAVKYGIKIVNSGLGGARNVVVTFGYPANMSFQTSTNWTGSGPSTYSQFTSVPAGDSVVIAASDSLNLLLADLNTITEGTVKTPTVSIVYDDTTNSAGMTGRTRTLANSPESFTVRFKSYSATIAMIDSSETAEAGDSAVFVYTITNNSNGYDAYDLRLNNISEGTWSWEAYKDNGNNTFSPLPNQDTLFTDDGSGYRSGAYIANGAALRLYVRAYVPSGLTSSQVNFSYFVSSARDSVTAEDDTLSGQFYPQIPNIVVTRWVVFSDSIAFGPASIVPGDTATYYVELTNTGTGRAKNLVLVDSIAQWSSLTAEPSSNPEVFVWDGSSEYTVNTISTDPSTTATGIAGTTVSKFDYGYKMNVAELLNSQTRRLRYKVTVN
ncbi:MAG: hypothetical protein WCW35_05855 [Bacteroidota bacterium]